MQRLIVPIFLLADVAAVFVWGIEAAFAFFVAASLFSIYLNIR